MCDSDEVKQIEPSVIFGFDGQVDYGLIVHPDKKHVIFPLGTKLVISDLSTDKQEFLSGHNYNISCVDLSSSGKLLASGQINEMRFRAYSILWDWATRKEIARHDHHKVRVESICITAEDKYMISLGGEDDGTIIVFDVETQTAICRAIASKATSGFPHKLSRLHNTSSLFICVGDRLLRIWSIKKEQKKLIAYDISSGKLQRNYRGLQVDAKDENLYLGTMTGDIVQVRLTFDPNNIDKEGNVAVLIGSYARHIPKKPKGQDCLRYVNGVRDLYIIDDKHFLIGDGEGTVELVQKRDISFKHYNSPTWPSFKTIYHTKVNGAVSSITPLSSSTFLIGTHNSEIYSININGFILKLLKTCHKSKVYDIAFPRDFSLVFATAGRENIRIWSTTKMKELLRIMVANFKCSSIVFAHDGTSIVSAWNDGVLRAFTPITGRLIYAIPNAHNKGCSAVTINSSGKTLVSGGVEGQVRVWKIEPVRQSLIGVLKEHSAPISMVDFNKFDNEVVSASLDGSCVVWDINRLSRKYVLYANTQFAAAIYYPTSVQILTCGSDRRICFWETYDGSLVRKLEGSKDAAINDVSICPSGEYFVSVANDEIVKVWDYKEGVPVLCGNAHSSALLCCSFAPNGKFFVTGSSVGTVMIWNIPEEYYPKNIDPLAVSAESESKKPPSRASSKSNFDGSKRPPKSENIEELETSRINKEVLCAECPAVDKKAMPDVNENCNMIPGQN